MLEAIEFVVQNIHVQTFFEKAFLHITVESA